MDALELRVFEAVARLGSMSRAASVLNTVQSNVTARIRSLEDELGVALFARSNRGVVLTDAGRRLLPFASRAARLLEDAKRAARDEGRPSGPLSIGSLETTVAIRIAPILPHFASAHPDVELSLKTGTSCELIDLVLAQALDGAFVCGPLDHPELEAEPMFSEELVLLGAPDRNGGVESIARSPDVRIVVLRSGCSYRLMLEAMLARRGIVGVRHIELGTIEAIVACVAAGLGFTLLPVGLIGTAVAAGRVKAHALTSGEGRVETVFVRRRDGFFPSTLRAFLDIARPELRRVAAE